MWPFNKQQRGISISDKGVMDQLFASTSEAGEAVTTSTAQSLPVAYAAVNMISEAVGTLPIQMYRDTKTGSELVSDHPIARLLTQTPNKIQTAPELIELVTRSCLLRGNSFLKMNYSSTGVPDSLQFMRPDQVTVKVLDDQLGYEFTDAKGNKQPLVASEVIHFRWRSDDGLIGKSPVAVCRDSLGLGLSEMRHGARWFKNGSRPAGVLSVSGSTTEQLGRVREALDTKFAGSNANKLILISTNDATDGAFKYQSLGFNNQDSQWLQSRSFTVDEVARMFNISPILLGRTEKASYANASEANRSFLTQTLNPWLRRIESTLEATLLDGLPMRLEFDTSGLLRASQKERFESYEIAIRAGVMTADECRQRENLPALGGYDGQL